MEDININLINKRELITICFVLTLLILFGTYNFVFSILGFSLLIYTILFKNEYMAFCVLTYAMPMARIFKIAYIGSSFITLLEVILVVIIIFKSKCKFSMNYEWYIFFVFYMLITQIINGGFTLSGTIKIAIGLFLIIRAVEIKLYKVYVYLLYSFVFGVLFASLIRLLDSNIFKISAMIAMKEEHLGYGQLITRFSGLHGDPNYYAINIILALIFISLLHFKGKCNSFVAGVIAIIITYFSIITASKSALIMIIITLLFFAYSLWKSRHYFITCIFTLMMIIGAINLVTAENSILSNVLTRIVLHSEQSVDMSTGRFELWSEYIDYLLDNPVDLLFGRSILYIILTVDAPHNTYIDMLYQLGIVGSFIYIRSIASCFKSEIYSNINIYNYAPYICLVIMYSFLSELQYFDLPFHCILCYCCLNIDTKKKTFDV